MWWLAIVTTASICMFVIIRKVLEALWWRPRRLEAHFAKQGIRGPPYKFFIGNVKELITLMLNSSSSPMANHNPHNILPRVLPFFTHWKKIYGSTFLLWFRPTARLAIADPDLIREIFVSKAEFYDRYESHPLVRQLEGEGLVSLRGEKWAHHRKVLTPTFHIDNLALLTSQIGKTVVDKLEKWSTISDAEDEVEIEVSEWFQGVTEDAITRTAFGRSYDDGKAVFKLQGQQSEKKDRPPLTFSLLIQFFLLALCGIFSNQGFYLLGLYYLSPTYASAIQNSVPAITFAMAVGLRLEQVNFKRRDGLAKIVGTVGSIAGATILTLYKGPPLFDPEAHAGFEGSMTAASSSSLGNVIDGLRDCSNCICYNYKNCLTTGRKEKFVRQ